MKGMSENLAVFMPIVKREASKRSHKKRSDSKEKLDQVSLRRGGTIRRPSSKVFESEQMNQLDESSGWYGYVEPVMDIAKDLFDGLPDMAKIGTAVVLVLWILYSWLFSGSDRTSINVGSNQPLVASRAVYLRDINEGLLDVDIKPAYGESET